MQECQSTEEEAQTINPIQEFVLKKTKKDQADYKSVVTLDMRDILYVVTNAVVGARGIELSADLIFKPGSVGCSIFGEDEVIHFKTT